MYDTLDRMQHALLTKELVKRYLCYNSRLLDPSVVLSNRR